jgi:hypothetical protein
VELEGPVTHCGRHKQGRAGLRAEGTHRFAASSWGWWWSSCCVAARMLAGRADTQAGRMCSSLLSLTSRALVVDRPIRMSHMHRPQRQDMPMDGTWLPAGAGRLVGHLLERSFELEAVPTPVRIISTTPSLHTRTHPLTTLTLAPRSQTRHAHTPPCYSLPRAVNTKHRIVISSCMHQSVV